METKINKLDEIEKVNPFKVPENYFAQFNEEIMNRLPAKEIPVHKKVPMWDKVKPWVYMAAMFVGLYFTVQFMTKRTVNNEQPIALQQQSLIQLPTEKYWSTVQISEEDFYQYLEDQLTEDGYYDYVYDQLYSTTEM